MTEGHLRPAQRLTRQNRGESLDASEAAGAHRPPSASRRLPVDPQLNVVPQVRGDRPVQAEGHNPVVVRLERVGRVGHPQDGSEGVDRRFPKRRPVALRADQEVDVDRERPHDLISWCGRGARRMNLLFPGRGLGRGRRTYAHLCWAAVRVRNGRRDGDRRDGAALLGGEHRVESVVTTPAFAPRSPHRSGSIGCRVGRPPTPGSRGANLPVSNLAAWDTCPRTEPSGYTRPGPSRSPGSGRPPSPSSPAA